MKAILITPDQFTIEEIEGSFDDFREIQKAIECDCFTVAGYLEGNAVYVDDEGLFKDIEMFTLMVHYPQPLAGKILVLGMTDDGGGKDVTLTVDQVSDSLMFMTPQQVADGSP